MVRNIPKTWKYDINNAIKEMIYFDPPGRNPWFHGTVRVSPLVYLSITINPSELNLIHVYRGRPGLEHYYGAITREELEML